LSAWPRMQHRPSRRSVHCVSWGYKKAIVNFHMSNDLLSMLCIDKNRSNLPLICEEREDCSRNTGEERRPDAQNTPQPTRWPGEASFWPAVTSMTGELPSVWLQTTIKTGSCSSLHARRMGWQPDALISLFFSPLPLPSREIMLKIPRGVHTIQS